MNQLKFENGKFKIMQIADIQDGPLLLDITRDYIEEMIVYANPDLVVLTGDNISAGASTVGIHAIDLLLVKAAIGRYMSIFPLPTETCRTTSLRTNLWPRRSAGTDGTAMDASRNRCPTWMSVLKKSLWSLPSLLSRRDTVSSERRCLQHHLLSMNRCKQKPQRKRKKAKCRMKILLRRL